MVIGIAGAGIGGYRIEAGRAQLRRMVTALRYAIERFTATDRRQVLGDTTLYDTPSHPV